MTAPTLIWSKTPTPGYFINSVSISADGARIAAGTFFHDYSSTTNARSARLAGARTDPQPSEYGTFGTYVWDSAGNALLSKTFDGWQGVYWVDLSGDGATVASGGWYQGTPTYDGFFAAYDIASGDSLLLYNPPKRGNVVRLNAHGTVLLAGADQGYLFVRTAGASFPQTPVSIALTDTTDEVLVAGLDASGSFGLLLSYHGEVIVFAQSGGVITQSQRWQVPNSAYVHAGAMAAAGNYAYVGANDGNVYALRIADFLQTPDSAWSVTMPGGATTIYGLCCSADGGLIGVAGNVSAGGGVVAYYANKYNAGALYWQTTTAQSPNGLSMDASGTYLGAADGHSSSGDFTLWQPMFDRQLWTFPTSEMCWPIAISANARYVAAGSDDSNVYLFQGPAGA